MQLFSREKCKARSAAQEPENQPLEPIALCLALWLGSMVCVCGLVRLSNDAAQATRAHRTPDHPALVTPVLYLADFGS